MPYVDRRKGSGGNGESPTKNQSLNGTGVVRGGVISVLSGTQLAKTEGFGEIIFTDNASGNTAIGVAWDDSPYTADLSSDGLFVLLCDETGTFSQIANDAYTSATRRDFLTFGAFTVSGGVIVSATSFVISSNEPVQQLFDLLACLGTIRCSGLNVSPNGTNMQFNLSSGVIHAIGSGSQLGGRAQNLTTINGQSPVVFDRLLGKTNNKPSTSVDVIDPDFYDNGTGSPVSIGGANKATIKYIFLLPSPNVSVVVMYGQTVYNSLADAVAAGADDGIVVPELYAKNALLVGRIAVASGTTDLSDPTKAKFLGGAKFGSGLAGGGSGGSGGGGDVIGAASSVQDEILSAADASGKVLKESGVKAFIADVDTAAIESVDKDLEIRNVTGKSAKLGGVTVDDNGTFVAAGNATTRRGVIQANQKPNSTSNFTDDLDCPVVSNVTTNNGGNIPLPPEPIFVAMRGGIDSQSWGNIFAAYISRYANVSTDARTQVDFHLSHTSGSAEGNNIPRVMSLRSDGAILDKDGNQLTSRLKTSTVRLYRSTAFNLPAGAGLGGVNFDGFENAIADGANITPNLSGSIYGVPSNGLYRVTIEFWVQRESGAASSHVDVMMNRAGFSDISDRANVVGTRVVFDNNQIPQKVTMSRTIRLTTSQTMQLRIGNNFDPISILCSSINPLTVSYDRIDD